MGNSVQIATLAEKLGFRLYLLAQTECVHFDCQGEACLRCDLPFTRLIKHAANGQVKSEELLQLSKEYFEVFLNN